MKYIFVAGPYSKGDVAVNVHNNIRAANTLAEAGFIPFSPLLAHFWNLIYPNSYEFWVDYNMAWLEKCDALLRLPGKSEGADREVVWMIEHGKPVYYSLDTLIYNIPE